MEEISQFKLLPATKYKDITPLKQSSKEYEIKTRHLRVYLFHDKLSGKIIVTGGKKTTQVKDIKRFRKIKEEYLRTR